ncbi:hypothetical protein M8C21_006515 [Ambrosia artemisiifolia]|uniref:C2H2-type domain-containing protein n=1 Tax=Ambrosia artemisiifolia TaxID=4212 RepID=A0AAD5GZT0_AMBAR|nr:hypothetical protein M8C21_006515 [Ambrosia artemisiifolia]
MLANGAVLHEVTYCQVCDVKCLDNAQYVEHCNGKKHRSKVAHALGQDVFYCGVCNHSMHKPG